MTRAVKPDRDHGPGRRKYGTKYAFIPNSRDNEFEYICTVISKQLVLKLRYGLSLFLFWAAVVIGSGQEPVEMAHRLYLAYDSARRKGDFALSEHYLNRILNDGYQLQDLHMAVVHNALGTVFYETGRLEDALLNYRTALGYISGEMAGSVPVRINIYNNIALLLNWQGDHSNALEHFDKANRLLDSLPDRNEEYFSQLSRLRFNKGIAYYKLGELNDALVMLKESERIKEKYKHQYLGSVYFNLALVYQGLKKPVQSETYYRKSIYQWISEKDTAYFQLANIYLRYGQFLGEQGEPVKGYEYYRMALQNYLTNYGIRHPLTAACYEQIARYHLERSEFLKSLEYSQLALISVSVNFNQKEISSNPAEGSSLHDLTLLKSYITKVMALEGLANEQPGDAGRLDLLQLALETNSLSIGVLHQLQESYLSSESRLYLLSNQKELYSAGIRLNISMSDLTEKKEFIERAYLLSAGSKSNELLFEMKAKERLLLESLHDTLASSILKLRAKRDLYSNLIQLESQERDPDSARIVAWKEKLFQISDTYQVQKDMLTEANPRRGHIESQNRDLSIGQVRKNLKRKETLVEYFIDDNENSRMKQLYTFIVTRHKCHVVQCPIDSSFYLNMENLMLTLHKFDPYKEDDRSYAVMKNALFGIYRQLIKPAEPFFVGNKLVIVPDEGMAYLPFDALLYRYEPGMARDYAGLPYLMDKYYITYAYNSQLITQRRKPESGFPKILTWLPGYVSSDKNSPWYLKGAVAEVGEIQKLLRGSSIPFNATKEEASKLLREKRILHLAMHARSGELNGGSPYFLLDPEEDSLLAGRLYDFEINGMNLQSPLVVLSSCRTGSGQLEPGEGIISLSRSFILAGAGSVVHTLWPVDDPRGPDIMVELYRGLKWRKSKGRALTEAKKYYLLNTSPSYTHPYYWASFQVTGDPVPLSGPWKFMWITGLTVLVTLLAVYLIRCSLRHMA